MEQIIVILILGAIMGVVRWVYQEYIADIDTNQSLEEKKEQSRLVDLKLKKYARIFLISMILYVVIHILYSTF